MTDVQAVGDGMAAIALHLEEEFVGALRLGDCVRGTWVLPVPDGVPVPYSEASVWLGKVVQEPAEGRPCEVEWEDFDEGPLPLPNHGHATFLKLEWLGRGEGGPALMPKLDLTKTDGSVSATYPEEVLGYYKRNRDENRIPKLPIEQVMYLVNSMAAQYKKAIPTALNSVEVPKSGNLIVCGDTHGQFMDMLWIFFKHGLPSPDHIYLFNGDICDRGESALEIFMVLFAFGLRYPGCVWINKGNHEDGFMNMHYGFDAELRKKYPRGHSEILAAFQKLFKLLPLATVISDKVFVVHGGLPRTPVHLDHIKSINHRRDAPSPPTNLHDYVFFDSIWSDPHEGRGVGTSDRGGNCVAFGPDITEKFLVRNKMSMVIRSHQVPERLHPDGYPAGFDWHHPIKPSTTAKPLSKAQLGMCLTVFSASNYCGHTANRGAVVVFENDVEQFAVLEHQALDMDTLVCMQEESETVADRVRQIANKENVARSRMQGMTVGFMRSSMIKNLKHLIMRKKQDLFDWFFAMDPEKDLHIPPEVWEDGCQSVLSDKLNWAEIRDVLHLVKNDSGLICYTHFLNRFQIRFQSKMGGHSGFERAISDRCYEMLLVSDLSLKDTFAMLDRNDDGYVSIYEFQEVLEDLGTGMTTPQIQSLMNTMIQHACPNAGIELEDFLSTLQLRYSATNRKAVPANAAWVPEFLGKVTRAAIAYVKKMKSVEMMVVPKDTPLAFLTEFFHMHDTDGSGFLEPQEFKVALKALPLCAKLSDANLDQLTKYCDSDGNGRINYLEFLHSLHVDDDASTNSFLTQDILAYIKHTLFFTFRQPMYRAFQALGTDDVRISTKQFKELIDSVNDQYLPKLLSSEQIDCLVNTLSVDAQGKLDFVEFIDSFEIVDELLDECM
eukprot:TRINITY_DN364_c0_g2_i2.p1 TRINITY_DN364_c0_g2~~TRINITY_DN364_c0_g2_i2.p1  ORF type:complete len:924 (+),score=312.15 TRINITY_DN364_c0_g2_i2:104-2773(+)